MVDFKVPDYTEFLNDTLEGAASVLKDASDGFLDFTDALGHDQSYETDSPGIYTAGLFRTSGSEDRAELSALNELGAQAGGVYIYVNNLIATAYTQGTIFFYDLAGAVSSIIQQPSPGVLGISSDTVDIIATTQIILDAPIVTVTGAFAATTFIGGDYLVMTDGITAPGATVGYVKIYVDTADGDLKIKFGDGVTKTIVTDT